MWGARHGGLHPYESLLVNRMFCPLCKAEYREGFYRCADCHVALVNTLHIACWSSQKMQKRPAKSSAK